MHGSASRIPRPADIEPVAHQTRDRAITAIVTVVPFLGLGFACWQAWHGILRSSDLIVFAILYASTGLGVTVGFHRLLTHRSFKTTRPLRRCWPCSGRRRSRGR